MTNHPAPEPRRRRRPAGKRTVAAFDFDGTLTSGGSVLPFLVAVRGPWPVLRAVGRLSPELLRSAVVGRHRGRHCQGEAVHPPARRPAASERWTSAAAAFAERHLARRLRPDTRLTAAVAPAPGPPRGRRLRLPGVLRAPGRRAPRGRRRPGHPSRPSVEAGSSPATTRGRTAGGLRSTPGWSSISGPTDFSAVATTSPSLWAYGNSRGDLRLLARGRPRHRRRVAGASGAPPEVPPALRCGQGVRGAARSARADRDAHDAPRVTRLGGRHVPEVGAVAEAERLPAAVDHHVP